MKTCHVCGARDEKVYVRLWIARAWRWCCLGVCRRKVVELQSPSDVFRRRLQHIADAMADGYEQKVRELEQRGLLPWSKS